MMSFSRNCKLCISLVIILFISLNWLPPSTGGSLETPSTNVQQLRKKLVLGSKPPTCLNKCMRCKPCQATLVIPPHTTTRANYVISSRREDGSYYLLSWKCRCGNKLYQP